MKKLLSNIWKNFPTKSAMLLTAAFASWSYGVGLPSVLITAGLSLAAYTFRRDKKVRGKLGDHFKFLIPMTIGLFAFHFKPLSSLAVIIATRLSNFSFVNTAINAARLLALKIPFSAQITRALLFTTNYLPAVSYSLVERTVNMIPVFALSNFLVGRLSPIIEPQIALLCQRIGFDLFRSPELQPKNLGVNQPYGAVSPLCPRANCFEGEGDPHAERSLLEPLPFSAAANHSTFANLDADKDVTAPAPAKSS